MNNLKKIIFVIISILVLNTAVHAEPFDYRYHKHWKYAWHQHSESSYQHAYCVAHNGIEEYINSDKTRVDCLTKDYAIEFDFANKWYEAIGQALHYGLMTGKKPKIVLILDKYRVKEQIIYYYRTKKIGDIYGIDVEYVTDDILDVYNHRCQYKDCRCHRYKYKNVFV